MYAFCRHARCDAIFAIRAATTNGIQTRSYTRVSGCGSCPDVLGFVHWYLTMDRSDFINGFVAKVETMRIAEIRHKKHANEFIGSALFTNLLPLAIGGLFIAAGVCVMHYIGMMAMVFDGTILWDGGIVAASVLIALVAATAALWIMFRLLAMFPNIELLRVACAGVAAVAVNGMHYTGMAAATFHYIPNKPKDTYVTFKLIRRRFTNNKLGSKAYLHGTVYMHS